MEKKPLLSIIILNYNTRKLLADCLGSILKQVQDDTPVMLNSFQHQKCKNSHSGNVPSNVKCQMLNLEVIVVDNGSTDGSAEYLQKLQITNSKIQTSSKFQTSNIKHQTSFKVVFSNKNLGFAGGNNLGLKKARGEFILFLNSDTRIKKQALVKVVDYLSSHDKAGALTPKTELFSGGMDPDCHRGFPTPWASITYFLGLEALFPKSKIFGQYHQLYLDLDKIHEIDAGFGTFLLTRKKIMDELGGWDEEYFFYGEDLDLFYRIKQLGYKVIFYPQVLVTHYKGGSSGLRKESRKMGIKVDKKTRVKTAQASVKAMEIFYRKFYKEKYPSWLTFLVILGIKAKGFFRVWFHKLR